MLRSPRYRNSYISIHALREEGDCYTPFSLAPVQLFLSTPSARRATLCEAASDCKKEFLSTPSARRATCEGIQQGNARVNFYPRPPRGGRQKTPCLWYTWGAFLSTPSARRATCPICQRLECFKISIHALREEGDLTKSRSSTAILHFYPRPPRGGRQKTPCLWYTWGAFLSTPSARRATCPICQRLECFKISIHALREEGD